MSGTYLAVSSRPVFGLMRSKLRVRVNDMAALVKALQSDLEEVFFKLLRRTHVAARKRAGGEVDEVDWIEKFHDLAATDLEDDLRRELRLGGLPLSIAVNSVLLHGRPFQAWPRWRHKTARSIEIGDLLLIGEYHEQSGILSERQALLLQMKVGTPSLPAHAPIRGGKAQAELYATWPSFNWSKKLRSMLPGPFPRNPAPGPSPAARFGIIPARSSPSWSSHEACLVEAGPRLRATEALQIPMARVVRLDVGIDATPGRGSSGGWSRIVQDMLDVAPRYAFRGQQRFASGVAALVDPGLASAHGGGDLQGPELRVGRFPRDRFAIVQVGFGPQGVLD
jgi:hypothetical protein